MTPYHLESPTTCPNCASALRLFDGRCANCMADLAGLCAACGVPRLRAARFCGQCGAAFATITGTAAESPIARRQLVAVFCDLVGSTILASRMDPEDFSAILRSFHRCVSGIVVQHGGFAASYMGDGVLSYFGYPQSREDDAERAVIAALAVAQAIPRIDAGPADAPLQLHVRIGLSAGIAVAGDVIGARGARGVDVAGEAPNLAARLQAIAAEDTVMIDGAVHELAGGLFDCRDAGMHTLKGWDHPVQAWQVLQPLSGASRFQARSRKQLTRLIGRATEMVQMEADLRDAIAGRGRAAVLTGEAGIGKSRLVVELLRLATESGVQRQHYHCAPNQQDVPLYPVTQAIAQAAGFNADDDGGTRRRKLSPQVRSLPECGIALVEALMMLPPPASGAALDMALPKRRERTLQTLMTMLLNNARSPLVIVVEDLHWSDLTTRELLDDIVLMLPDHPIMLVVTTRPGGEPDWAKVPAANTGWRKFPHTRQIALPPLNATESLALVHAVCGHAALPRATIDRIVARSDGVPLFLEEVGQAVSAAFLAAPAATGDGRIPVPLTLNATLLDRLDRLGWARDVAETASVIGRSFSADLLALVSLQTPESLAAALEQMQAADIIRANAHTGEPSYRFRHALIRDAAYGTIIRPRLQDLHGRVARAMETGLPRLAAAEPQMVAYHFTKAGQNGPAARWWLSAGTQSLLRASPSEALVQLQRGLDVLAAMHPDAADSGQPADWRARLELDLLVMIGKVQTAMLGHAAPLTGAAFARARTICDTLDAPASRLQVLFGQWTHLFARADLPAALEQAGEILATGEKLRDNVWELIGCYALALTNTPQGNFAISRGFLDRALNLFDPAKRPLYAAPLIGDARVLMRAYVSMNALCEGNTQLCRTEVDAALEEARHLKQPFAICQSMLQRGFNALHLETPDRALAKLDELKIYAQERGLPFFEGLADCFGGYASGLLGDYAAGLDRLRTGDAMFRATGSIILVPTYLRMQAEMMGWSGAPEQGIMVLAEAVRTMQNSHAFFDSAEMNRVHGSLLARIGEHGAAIACFDAAIDLASAQGADLFGARARITRGQHIANHSAQAAAE